MNAATARTPLLSILALMLVALVAPSTRADLAAEHAALEAELVQRLEALAQWCEESDLLVQRNEVYEQLLVLAPDHHDAHEALGHREQKDGSWVVPSRVKRVYDDERALEALAPELRERRREAIGAYRDAALALVDGNGVDDPAARAALLQQVEATVLGIDPDDPEVRERRGEARYGNAWVLAETARAYERRPALRRYVADAVRRAGARDTLTKVEPATQHGIEWSANARTPVVQVYGTGMLEESLRAAQATHATVDVFRRVFGGQTTLPPDLTVYLLAQPDEVGPFLDGLPDLTDDERAFLARLVGTGIPRTANTAQWADSIARRLDGVVRHMLGQLFLAEFRLTTDNAWAWEGFGLYLTRELVGSRLTWYIGGADESTELAKLRADLLVQEANWINAAYQLLKGPEAPALGDVLTQDAGAMGVDGMLAAYALCAYLLEGRPEELSELLFRIGRDQDPATAVGEALGLSLDELRERLVRWLSERRHPEYYRS